MQLNASEVYLGLSRIEAVTYKERKAAAEWDSEAA